MLDKIFFAAARASIERFREELRQAEAEKRRKKQVGVFYVQP